MDKRFKIIAIALSVVYLVIIGGVMQEAIADFTYGFWKGFEVGSNIHKSDTKMSLASSGTLFLLLKPENGLRTFPAVIPNLLSEKMMKAEIGTMVVEVDDASERLPRRTRIAEIAMGLISLFSIFIMFFIPIKTFQIVRSITRNKIFDPANIRKLRTIGYALLGFYLAGIITNCLHYWISTFIVKIEGYVLQLDWGNTLIVILGFVVLLFAEMLKATVTLKEEQDLTI